MSNVKEAVSAQAFENRYGSESDPWNYRSSAYERGKYEATLAALRHNHYDRAFEPGCSIGELTALLAPRCGFLLATDFSPTAVARARRRCKPFGQVRIDCQDLDATLPEGPFDLVILSEIGYYFAAERLARLAASIAAILGNRGELVAVHWTGHSEDHLLHADEVHAVLNSALPLNRIAAVSCPGFRLEQWVKT